MPRRDIRVHTHTYIHIYTYIHTCVHIYIYIYRLFALHAHTHVHMIHARVETPQCARIKKKGFTMHQSAVLAEKFGSSLILFTIVFVLVFLSFSLSFFFFLVTLQAVDRIFLILLPVKTRTRGDLVDLERRSSIFCYYVLGEILAREDSSSARLTLR